MACEQCTFLLPSSSSSSLAVPTSLRMGLCRGEGAWPGRLRVDIWKEGERQRGLLELNGESCGLSMEEPVRKHFKKKKRSKPISLHTESENDTPNIKMSFYLQLIPKDSVLTKTGEMCSEQSMTCSHSSQTTLKATIQKFSLDVYIFM